VTHVYKNYFRVARENEAAGAADAAAWVRSTAVSLDPDKLLGHKEVVL